MYRIEIRISYPETLNVEDVHIVEHPEGVRLDKALHIAHVYANNAAAFGAVAKATCVKLAGTKVH